MHRFVLRAEELVYSELGHEGDRLGRILTRKLLEGSSQTETSFLLPPEEAFHACTSAGQPCPLHVRVGGNELDGLEQVTVALGVSARRGERRCPGDEEL